MSEFQRLQPHSLQSEIADLLEAKILNGDFPVGSKLPTENEMSRSLGVSRNVLREAVAKLKSLGLLESRQGSGVFVIRNAHIPTFRMDDASQEKIETLRGLMELRFSIEISTAQMAAIRRTQAQLKSIKRAQKALRKAVKAGQPGVAEDIQFHVAIAEATNNVHYRDFIHFLQQNMRQTVEAARKKSARIPGRPEMVISEHEAIISAIEDGDAEGARFMAWKHQINAARRIGIRGLHSWESLRMLTLSTPRFIPVRRISSTSPPPKKPLPENACDTHVCLFGDPKIYNYPANRSYTPSDKADLGSYEKFAGPFGIKRAVLIQPSVYGPDNSVLLDALKAAGNGKYRGVVCLKPDIADSELSKMHRVGVRGVRINTIFRNDMSSQDLVEISARIKHLGWHIDLLTDVSEHLEFYSQIRELDLPVVVDHLGHMPTDIGLKSVGFKHMLRLLEEGLIWVRLSGFCRLTKRETLPFDDVKPYVDALLRTRPDRLLWGGDWPHPAIDFTPPSYADLFDQFADWVTDTDLLDQIMNLNPTELYWGTSKNTTLPSAAPCQPPHFHTI